MAASALTPQSCGLTGLEATYGAANAEGNYFTNSGREIIHIKNGHSSPQTVTIDSPTECNQGATHDCAVEITEGEDRFIGPFPKGRFDDPNGRVNLSYSGVTALTIAVITVP
jgi:hypothetical protein